MKSKILSILLLVIFMLPISTINVPAAITDYKITASVTEDGNDISSLNAIVDTPIDSYFRIQGLSGATDISDAIFIISVEKPSITANVSIIANDALGEDIDVAQLGFWGPPSGFPINDTIDETQKYENTFDMSGTYKIIVDLVQVSDPTVILSTKTLTVNVTNPIDTVTVTPATKTIRIKETVQLNAIITPADADPTTFVWSSSNPAIASVDSTGIVTGNAIGQATITVKTADGTKSGTAVIKVEAIPKTGDQSNTMLFSFSIVAALFGILAVENKRRQSKKY